MDDGDNLNYRESEESPAWPGDRLPMRWVHDLGAFSANRSRYDRMLARMFGTAGDGQYDRLTDFSRPMSGAYYFAPSLNALRELAV